MDERITLKIKTLDPATYELPVSTSVSSEGLSQLAKAAYSRPEARVRKGGLSELLVQATFRQVKQQLADLTRIPPDRQRLIYRGTVLQDSQTVSEQRRAFAAEVPARLPE